MVILLLGLQLNCCYYPGVVEFMMDKNLDVRFVGH